MLFAPLLKPLATCKFPVKCTLLLLGWLSAAGCVSPVLRQKTLLEVHNDLILGCETLDRDYADYDAYKEYLEPLGIRYIRLQAGWAKCEKERGVYDFAWLDHIIDDAVSRGLEPWLELSYGNPVYPGGGTAMLTGGWPRGSEAIEGWKSWTRELALRYKGKVHQWEIWNEPENGLRREGRDPAEMAELAVITARIIKGIDSEALVAAYGIGRVRRENGAEALITGLAAKLKASGELHLIDAVSYHGYHYIPEESYFIDADSLRAILAGCGWDVDIWQGECGAPSVGYMGGALADYPWSEVSQAKWALRKMLCDHAHGIRTSIFSIADMNYAASDAIKKKNHKGLLETDENNRVLRPKLAYDAVRNLVSVYDNLDVVCDSSAITVGRDSIVAYLFDDSETHLQSAVLWISGAAPTDSRQRGLASVTIRGFRCCRPVCVDLLDGRITRLRMRRRGGDAFFPEVPIYDSPVLICSNP